MDVVNDTKFIGINLQTGPSPTPDYLWVLVPVAIGVVGIGTYFVLKKKKATAKKE